MLKIKLLLVYTSLCLGTLNYHQTVTAQVVPDSTLPVNSITSFEANTFVIDGGTAVGTNLFHSFKQFSLPTGSNSYFNNASNIQNIFSRVTGTTVSQIDGFIKANGSANLFFLNPNGIIFGPNAALDLGGSFLASTADYVQFNNGTKFSAVDPQSTLPLNVNVPIGLGFGLTPGQISLQGSGHELRVPDSPLPVGSPLLGGGESSRGLRTAPGKTLSLVGGQVIVDGGIITAPSGQIRIGSVTAGVVSLTLDGFTLDYDGINDFQDIHLDNTALIDASGILNSQINIRSRNLYLDNGALILISNVGDQSFGKIDINTTNSIVITGISDPKNLDEDSISSLSIGRGILSQNLSSFKGADIIISAQNLSMQANASIATNTFSEGQGGNLTIRTVDSLDIKGDPPIDFTFLPSGIGTLSLGAGQGGNLQLEGKNLVVKNGGLLITQAWNTAKGGDLIANFSESIDISGGFALDPKSDSFIPSTLGSISIVAGDAGNILVNTRELTIKDGGRINATTANFGDGGDLVINATDSIKVEGRIENSTGDALYNLSQIVASATQNNSFLLRLLNLPNLPQGDAGNININTNKLIVQDEGQISVINAGSGEAGTVKIISPFILINNRGQITAETQLGNGGDINLQTQNLQLHNNSSITATASGSGDGGDIGIATNTLVGLENSDIIANAFAGRGGRVQIDAQAIFGTQARLNLTPESDITADSGVGIDGEIEINTLDFDARNSLTPLQSNFINTEDVVARSCLARRNQNQGSLYINQTSVPVTPLSGMSEWMPTEPELNAQQNSPRPIEAQGIFELADGRLILGDAHIHTDAEQLVCVQEVPNN